MRAGLLAGQVESLGTWFGVEPGNAACHRAFEKDHVPGQPAHVTLGSRVAVLVVDLQRVVPVKKAFSRLARMPSPASERESSAAEVPLHLGPTLMPPICRATGLYHNVDWRHLPRTGETRGGSMDVQWRELKI